MRRTFIQARPSIPRDSMIPGGRVNPRQMRQAMKRLGIEQEELAGVEEVVIRTATPEYVIRDPNVTAMTAQRQKICTVVGEPIVRDRRRSLRRRPAEPHGVRAVQKSSRGAGSARASCLTPPGVDSCATRRAPPRQR